MASLSAASPGEIAACLLTIELLVAYDSRHFEDRSCLEKGADAVRSVFAANARELEPAPGCLGIVCHAVDHDSAGTQLRSHASRARWVGPEDGGVKTIIGVVCDSDRIFVGVICNHAKHGTKDFLPRDCHVVRDAHEYCRLYEVTRFESLRMAFSADQHLGAFFNAFANVGLHTIELLLRHHGPYGSLGVGWVADREGAHRVRDGALDGVEPLARHEETRPS